MEPHGQARGVLRSGIETQSKEKIQNEDSSLRLCVWHLH